MGGRGGKASENGVGEDVMQEHYVLPSTVRLALLASAMADEGLPRLS
jgi:hypothetical protein